MKVTLRISFLLLCFVSISQSLFSQQPTANNYMKEFDKIDSLASIAQANKALPILEKLMKQARTEGNSSMLVKSVMYRMLFQSYLKDNAFEEILNDLRNDIKQAKQPEKSILQSLLAEMYWKYYQQNSYRIAKRTNVETKLSDEIGTWSIRQITNETAKNYLNSLSEANLLQKIKVGVFNEILIGDSSNRDLRPSLYDLLAHRALDVFMNPQIDITNTDMEGINFDDPIWFADHKTFSAIKIPQADSSYFSAEALKVFQQLLKVHDQQNSTAALTEIELKRLKFIYGRSADEHKDSLYFNALESLGKKMESNPLNADILFQQAEIYKNGGQQDSSKQNLVKAMALLEKAIKTYPESQGAKKCSQFNPGHQDGNHKSRNQTGQSPGTPDPAFTQLQNIDTAHLKLYKIPATEDESYVDFRNEDAYQLFLKKEKPFRTWSVHSLP
jgi:tetratricopeptide (TPR) repeat protein